MGNTIIIGAGYAGMSAASLLANAGRKVIIILESSRRIGGRANSTAMRKAISESTAHIRTGLRIRALPMKCSGRTSNARQLASILLATRLKATAAPVTSAFPQL